MTPEERIEYRRAQHLDTVLDRLARAEALVCALFTALQDASAEVAAYQGRALSTYHRTNEAARLVELYRPQVEEVRRGPRH